MNGLGLPERGDGSIPRFFLNPFLLSLFLFTFLLVSLATSEIHAGDTFASTGPRISVHQTDFEETNVDAGFYKDGNWAGPKFNERIDYTSNFDTEFRGLQLTENSNDQGGAVLHPHTIRTDGDTAFFNFKWNAGDGDGADGQTIFFANPNKAWGVGDIGGSLGFAEGSPTWQVFAIGLDDGGFFCNDGSTPDQMCIDSAGNKTIDWTSPAPPNGAATFDDGFPYTLRVEITADNMLNLEFVDAGSNNAKFSIDLADSTSLTPPLDDLAFGFSGATGADDNHHQIVNLREASTTRYKYRADNDTVQPMAPGPTDVLSDTYTAHGGAGSGWSWSIASAPSHGTIDSSPSDDQFPFDYTAPGYFAGAIKDTFTVQLEDGNNDVRQTQVDIESPDNSAPSFTDSSSAEYTTEWNVGQASYTPDSIPISSLIQADSVSNSPGTDTSVGVAVTSVDTSNGTWQYTLDGSTWDTFPNLSGNTAVVFHERGGSDIAFRVRTDTGFRGPSIDTGLVYRGWDQTDGSSPSATQVSISSTGGTTAFTTDTSAVNVNMERPDVPVTFYVNDADTSGDVLTNAAGEDTGSFGSKDNPLGTLSSAVEGFFNANTFEQVHERIRKGDTILLDVGTYTPSQDITINTDAVHVSGVDSSATVIDFGDSTQGNRSLVAEGFSAGSVVENVTFEDFRVTGARIAIKWGTESAGFIRRATKGTVRRVHVTGNQRGIDLDNADNNTFKNNLVEDNSYNGIKIRHSDGNTFESNVVRNNGVGDETTSTADDQKANFKLYGAQNNTFTSNKAINSDHNGFLLNHPQEEGENRFDSGAHNNTFTSNVVKDNGTSGFFIYNSDSQTIENNVIRNNTTRNNDGDAGGQPGNDRQAGILLSGSNQAVITQNTIVNNQGHGIRAEVDSSDRPSDTHVIRRNLVKGHSFSDFNRAAGINLAGSKYNNVTLNQLDKNEEDIGLETYEPNSTLFRPIRNIIHKNNMAVSEAVGETVSITGSTFKNKFDRNYFTSTDKDTIRDNTSNSLSATDTDEVTPYVPYRMGPVDTGVGADTFAPFEVTVDTVISGGGQAEIRWQEVTNNERNSDSAPIPATNDFLEYRVYRDTDPNQTDWKQNGTVVGTVGTKSDTSFIDSTVESGVTYYYRVTAVDDPGVDGGDGTADLENESYIPVDTEKTLAGGAAPVRTVQVDTSGNGSATISGGGDFVEGETITVMADPDTGTRFIAWVEGSDTRSTSPDYTFTVSGDSNLTAKIDTFTSTVEAPDDATTTTNEDGSTVTTYETDDGDSVNVTQYSDGSNGNSFTADGTNGQSSVINFDGGTTETVIDTDGTITIDNTTNGKEFDAVVNPDGTIAFNDDGSGTETYPAGTEIYVDEDGNVTITEPDDMSPNNEPSEDITNESACFVNDFEGGELNGWSTLKSKNFEPRVVPIGTGKLKNRMRLTQNQKDQAGGVTKDIPIPSDERVEIAFYAHTHGGNGGDGLALVLSAWGNGDTPSVGALGGALGYAQGTSTDGFDSGWLAIGLDEGGDFANSNDGKEAGPGYRRNAISIRGSGSGQDGYRYIDGTRANLAPKFDNNMPGQRFRVIIDGETASDSDVLVSLLRSTGREETKFDTLINQVNMTEATGQDTTPERFRLSFTGSTSKSTNYHEIGFVQVSGRNCGSGSGSGPEVQSDTFSALDGDTSVDTVQTTGNDTVSFFLSGGPDSDVFSIDSQTGKLSFDTPLEVSSPDSFIVEVNAEDSAGIEGDTPATIQVNVFPKLGVAVDSPTAGDVLSTNDTTLITWSETQSVNPIDTRIVQFRFFDTGTFDTLATFPGTASDSEWAIPDTPTEKGTLRVIVQDTGTNTASDTAGPLEINSIPEISPLVSDQSDSEDTSPWSIPLKNRAQDQDGDSLAWSVSGGGTVVNASLTNDTFTADGEDTLTLTPVEDANGTDTFTLSLGDGRDTDVQTFTVTLTPVNDAPEVSTLPDRTDVEDTDPWSIGLGSKTSDVEGDSVKFVVSGGGTVVDPVLTDGGFSNGGNDTLTISPIPDANGTDTLTLSAGDGKDTSTQTFTVTLTPVNDTPFIDPPVSDQTDSEDAEPFTVFLGDNANDSDVGETTTWNVSGFGNVVETRLIDGDTLEFDPISDANGTETGVLTLADDSGAFDTQSLSVFLDPVNDTPIARSQRGLTLKDESLDITLEGSDTDVGDTLAFDIAGNPKNGNLVGSDSTVTYEPDMGFVGQDTFTFTVDDGKATSKPGTVTVIVDRLLPVDREVSTREDSSVTTRMAGVSKSDTALSFEVVSAPDNGTLGDTTRISDTEVDVDYTPDNFFNGSDTFGYVVRDGTDTSVEGIVDITVEPVNNAPVPDPASITTDEDRAANVVLSGTDAEKDQITYVLASGPDSGTVGDTTRLSDTRVRVTYTPDADENGTDAFTFRAGDGADTSSEETVMITINPVNDTPFIDPPVADQSDSEDADPFTVFIGDSANDTDAGDTISWSVSGFGSIVDVTVIDGDTLQFDSITNANGTETGTLTLTDSDGATDTQPLSVFLESVNDVPVPDSASATTNEDSPVDLVLSGTDAEKDQITYPIASGPDSGTLGNTTRLSDTRVRVTYTPDVNENGTDEFTFKAGDGKDTSTAETATITINPVNDVPVTQSISGTTNEDSAVGVVLSGTDAEKDQITYPIASGPDSGTLGDTTRLSDTRVRITYTPDADENGTDLFTFKAGDGKDTSAAETVSITVNPVNDTPFIDPTVSGQSDSEDADPWTVYIGDSANDTDAGDDPNWSVSGFGDVVDVTVVDGDTLQFDPITNANGTETGVLTLTDADGAVDTQPLSVFLAPVNDTPIAKSQRGLTLKNRSLDIKLEGSDPDEGDTLTFNTASTPTNGILTGSDSTVTYEPDTGFIGQDTFTFTVDDGKATSKPGTVTVFVDRILPVDRDVTTDEDSTVTTVLAGISESDTPLEERIVSGPDSGTLGDTNRISDTEIEIDYIPNPNENGFDTFGYRVSDGADSSPEGIVDVTVNPVNDAPVPDPVSVTTDEDSAITVVLSGTDVDGDAITYILDEGPGSGTIGGTTSLSDTRTRITYTPDANENGTEVFTFQAGDGQDTSTAETVTITVNPVNDTPISQPRSVTTAEDRSDTITLTGVDPDGDVLTFDVTDTPSLGVLSDTTRVSDTVVEIRYEPDPDENGTDTFQYQANDGQAVGADTTVTITIDPVNDTPFIDPAVSGQSDSEDADPWTVYIGDSANDTDAGDDPDWSVSGFGDVVDVTVVDGDTLQFDPITNANGTETGVLTLTDADGAVDTQPLSVFLAPVNDTPVALSKRGLALKDQSLDITLEGTDPDEGDTLSYTIDGTPVNGTLTGSDSTVTYEPDTGFVGTDTFTFTVSDGQSTSTPGTISVIVDDIVPVDRTVTTDEDSTVTAVLAGITSSDTPLTETIVTLPTDGTLGDTNRLSDTRVAVDYRPDADFNGSDTFGYTITDGTNTSIEGIVDVTVTPVNDTPFISPHVADQTDSEDADPFTVFIGDNANDTDAGDTPDWGVSGFGSIVNVTVVNGDTLEFTPVVDANGTETGTLTLTDADGAVDTQPLSVTLTVVNDTPVIDTGQLQVSDQGRSETLFRSTLEGDSALVAQLDHDYQVAVSENPDTVTIFYRADGTPATTSDSAFTMSNTNGDTWAGTLPNGNIDAGDTINFIIQAENNKGQTSISDRGGQGYEYIVRLAEVLAMGTTVRTIEDSSVNVPLEAIDAMGDSLTYQLVEPLGLQGELSDTGMFPVTSGTSPVLTYNPGSFSGTETFQFTAENFNGKDTATVTLDVTGFADIRITDIETQAADTPLVAEDGGTIHVDVTFSNTGGTGTITRDTNTVTAVNGEGQDVTSEFGRELAGPEQAVVPANGETTVRWNMTFADTISTDALGGLTVNVNGDTIQVFDQIAGETTTGVPTDSSAKNDGGDIFVILTSPGQVDKAKDNAGIDTALKTIQTVDLATGFDNNDTDLSGNSDPWLDTDAVNTGDRILFLLERTGKADTVGKDVPRASNPGYEFFDQGPDSFTQAVKAADQNLDQRSDDGESEPVDNTILQISLWKNNTGIRPNYLGDSLTEKTQITMRDVNASNDNLQVVKMSTGDTQNWFVVSSNPIVEGSPGDFDVTFEVSAPRGFSVFRIITSGPGTTTNADEAIVYPNPFVPHDGDPSTGQYGLSDGDGIHFGTASGDGFPAGSELSIYTVNGERVASKTTASGGIIQWNAKTRSGEKVASDVYIWVIDVAGGGTKHGKLSIVR